MDRRTSQIPKTPYLEKIFSKTLSSKVEKEAVLTKAVVTLNVVRLIEGRRSPAVTGGTALVTVSFFMEPSCWVREQAGQELPAIQYESKKESGYHQGRYFSNTQKHTHTLFHKLKLPLQQRYQINHFNK